MLPLSPLGISPLREEVIFMESALISLVVGVVSTVVGTVVGNYIYENYFKK